MRKFLLHLSFWLLFLLLWNQVVYFYISNNLNRIYFSVLDVSLIVTAFYIIYLYIMPDYFRRKKIAILILLSALTIVGLGGVYSWIMGIFLRNELVPIHFNFTWNYTSMQYNRLLIASIGVLAGTFVKLAADRIEVRRRMEKMEKEKSLAELTYLRAQINPHFLFNSLNSLYTQLELQSQNAKCTLVSISDLLRYQLYECNFDFVPISKEVAYVENYYSLQSIRMDNCTTNLFVGRTDLEIMIAPLLLIPFIENAFKYVSDHDDKENFIKIKIDFIGRQLNFSCINTVDPVGGNLNIKPDKGIGLLNVTKRLNLIYKDHHQLNISSDQNFFEIILIVDL